MCPRKKAEFYELRGSEPRLLFLQNNEVVNLVSVHLNVLNIHPCSHIEHASISMFPLDSKLKIRLQSLQHVLIVCVCHRYHCVYLHAE